MGLPGRGADVPPMGSIRAFAPVLLVLILAGRASAGGKGGDPPRFGVGCRAPVPDPGAPGPRTPGPCGRCPAGACPEPAEPGRTYASARVPASTSAAALVDALTEAIGGGRVPAGGLGIRAGWGSPSGRGRASFVVSIPSELFERSLATAPPGLVLEPL